MQNRPSADALMMRAGYAVTGRPIGLWLGEEGVGARAVRGHSPVVTRRGCLPWPSWTTIAHTPEATMRSIRRSAPSYWSLGQSRATWTRSSPISSVRRAEEHTSELQSLMRISYAVFCLKKKKHTYDVQPQIPALIKTYSA